MSLVAGLKVKLLSGVPQHLVDSIVNNFQEITGNYLEHKWEPSELNGGKFCESAYCILKGAIEGAYPTKVAKPSNMAKALRDLENTAANPTLVGDKSLRVLIPKVLLPLYEIRNNRGVGHVGGDVSPNAMDAAIILAMASWVMAELVRIFHDVSIKEAQDVVGALSERRIPLIWEVEGTKRILEPAMKVRDQVLVLLYGQSGWSSDKDLCTWVEYSTLAMLRTRVLRPLHANRLIEYDEKRGLVRISPLGAREIEAILAKQK